MNKIKISIILPVYNAEKTLHRCLDTLVNQTLEEMEIICINDASTDNSLKILLEYEKKYKSKIRVIDCQDNGKAGTARNKGLDIATGEYIGFVDGDDFVAESMYEKLYNKAKKEKADVVDCNYYEATSKENVVSKIISNAETQIGVIDSEKRKLLIVNPGRIWTKIYKKENLQAIRFPEQVLYEDNPFAIQAVMKIKKLAKVSEYLYYYSIEPHSITRKKNKESYFERMTTCKILLEQFISNGYYEEFFEEIEYKFTELFYINTIFGCVDQFDKIREDKIILIKKEIREVFPGFKKNKYYIEHMKNNRKKAMRLNIITRYLWLYKIFNKFRKS